MKIVIFGLAASSSWGNGHATLWRGLLRSLARGGHDMTFYERDVPYYARRRDLVTPAEWSLVLYGSWADVLPRIRADLACADVAVVTSYCPDALAAAAEIGEGRALATFYDLDTGVTLDRLAAGSEVPYLGPRGLADYDLVLSYIGGSALDELRWRLGAGLVVPIYGCVDPEVHAPAGARDEFRADLSYLGTYARDRQAALEALFLEPARAVPSGRFLLGGPMYPAGLGRPPNVALVEHVAPRDHAAFYSSSRFTLSVTRGAMARYGYCPSGRLFEAAACGTPVISDDWEGLSTFFTPGREILVAGSSADTLEALRLSAGERDAIARRARERALDEHTADRRAREMVAAFESARGARAAPAPSAIASEEVY
jgi:spore maturation protein CgeB